MLSSACSQGALVVAIKLLVDFMVGELKDNGSADELLYIAVASLVFVLGQYTAKALVVSALLNVQLKFQLKTTKKSGFIAPFLVESRQLLLSIPRIIVALSILVIITHNLLIIGYAPIIVAIYCYSAIKIEQNIKSKPSMLVWDRLHIQNLNELIFTLIAIILCVVSILSKTKTLSLGDYAYLLVAFRVTIGDLSNIGYSLPRQVRYIHNLPNWPKFFGSIRLWR